MRRNMDMQIGALTMSMTHGSMTEQSPGLRHLDPDTDFKVRRITSSINEAIHMAANEPSLGLYRIQEHVHRTVPQLAIKKKDLKTNKRQIDETLYDLNLSMDVVDSMRNISNFTRIQEVLKTVLVTKENLNKLEEDEKVRKEYEYKNAKIANRSLSCNEPAEGYICPVCYFALSGQEELILHWQKEHNLEECDNETFQEVEMPADENSVIVEDCYSTSVILSPTERRAISEGEDVLGTTNYFLEQGVDQVSETVTSNPIDIVDDLDSSQNIETILQEVIDIALTDNDRNTSASIECTLFSNFSN